MSGLISDENKWLSKFIELLTQHMSKSLNRPISNIEYRYITNIINKMNLNIYKNYSVKQVIEIISEVLISKFQSFDIHEMLKKMIDKETHKSNISNISAECISILDYDNILDVQNIINPYSKIKRDYIILDTKYRSLSTDGTILFRWYYSNVLSNTILTPTNDPSIAATKYPINNIISMRLYQPTIPSNYTNRNTSYLPSLGILIEELRSQSYAAGPKINYHWFLTTSYANLQNIDGFYFNFTGNTEPNGDAIYRFRKPIKELYSLTVSINDGYNNIQFYPDRMLCSFTYGITTTISTLGVANHLLNQMMVSFVDFTTNDPVKDASIINQMNGPYGFRMFILTASTFYIALNTSTITPKPGLQIMCYFDNYRTILPIEITYLDNYNALTDK